MQIINNDSQYSFNYHKSMMWITSSKKNLVLTIRIIMKLINEINIGIQHSNTI